MFIYYTKALNNEEACFTSSIYGYKEIKKYLDHINKPNETNNFFFKTFVYFLSASIGYKLLKNYKKINSNL